MTEIEVSFARGRLPTDSDLESVAASLGLRITLKGTLAKFPGCTHWHFKLGREPGTLELTRCPDERRVWISIQDRRQREWVERIAQRLQAAVEQI